MRNKVVGAVMVMAGVIQLILLILFEAFIAWAQYMYTTVGEARDVSGAWIAASAALFVALVGAGLWLARRPDRRQPSGTDQDDGNT